MAFVPVPDTLAVDVIYEQLGQRVENTLYFESPGGWTGAQVADWLDQLRTLIEEDLLPLLHAGLQLVQLVGTLLDAVDSLSITLNVSPPVAGSGSGDSLPNNVTYTVQFKTASRGRSFRGRNYVPGIPDTQVTGNQIESAFRTGILDFYSTLLALASSNSFIWVVVSRFHNLAPRTTGVTTPIIEVATADANLDSQRRRLTGRGT
jgi:hypothetical protein